MLTATALAGFSDDAVYAAIAVYGLALLGYAADSALHSSPSVPSATSASTLSGPALSNRARAVSRSATPRRRIGRAAVSLTVLAFGLHLTAVASRALAAGRAPWGNMYEFALAAGVAATGAYLMLLRREPVRYLGGLIVALVLLTLGLSVTVLYAPVGGLVPALNSYWLVVHVAAAIIAGGVFTVGAAAGTLHLVRLRAGRQGRFSRLPTPETLDRTAHLAHLFALPIWTFAVLAGAIWAENAWGRYWGWDPKETWAFITWVLYAAYLHAQATPAWRGRRATWFALAGYLSLVFNFFGVNMWITGLHSYAGI